MNCKKQPRHKHTARPHTTPTHHTNPQRDAPFPRTLLPSSCITPAHVLGPRTGNYKRKATIQTAERPLRRSPQPHLPTTPLTRAQHTTPAHSAMYHSPERCGHQAASHLRTSWEQGQAAAGDHSDNSNGRAPTPPEHTAPPPDKPLPSRRMSFRKTRPHAAQRTEVYKGVASPPHRA